MMEKLFNEDNWDRDLPESEGNFIFKKLKTLKDKKKMEISSKPPKNSEKAKKKKKLKKLDNGELPEQLPPGRFVRIQKEPEELKEPTPMQKGKKRKLNDDPEPVTDPKKAKKEVGPKKELSLKEKLVESLKGSRFRFLNEQMYKTTGAEAEKLFKEDPSAFTAYHDGYRHQVEQWQMNPLNRIINNIKKLPMDHIVADFGCGEARLAKSVSQKVYSLDLVAADESVIACDMAKTPLESHSVNVVVFCLSLMGTNVKDFLLEANRVLKTGGLLKIAEVSSRFETVKLFIDCVSKCGYELVNKDLGHKLFYFFNFKKVRNVDKTIIKVKDFSLKPCLYKKR